MSKEEKVEYLRQKIKEAKRTGWIYNVLLIVGLVGFTIGFFGGAFDMIIMGVALIIISLVLGLLNDKRKNDLMKQLRKTGYEEKE